jgi:hypothetical protein
MGKLPEARWWTVRPAANRKPTTYRCPICGHLLPALKPNALIAPEGDMRRRRHAHPECVVAARRRGEIVLEDEWRRSQREQARAARKSSDAPRGVGAAGRALRAVRAIASRSKREA